MSFPTAAGWRNIGSSDMNYIPTIYSAKWLVKFYKRTVFGAISNHDHEQEIANFGDTVEIRALPDIATHTYRKGMVLDYQQPSSTSTQLLIDKGTYWAFPTNKVDDKQTDMKDYISAWGDDAMKKTQEAIDLAVLGNVYSDAASTNKGSTAGAISGNINLGIDGGVSVLLSNADVLDNIVKCGQALTENDVPEEGRWMVIPAWMATLISTSDLKDASLAGDDTSILRNGRLGKIATFTLYQSNQLSTGADSSANTCTRILFGTNAAITFATQITENEHLVNPNDFGMLHRGLQVYGYKVVKPEALGVLFAYAA